MDPAFDVAGVRWTDVVDVAVVTVLIYWALVVIRGTRAFQSLLGLVFLGALYAVSAAAGLHTIYWLLDKFFVYVVLAVLILFQADIRRGLARAGGGLFEGFAADEGASHALEEVVKAAFALASRRIGALIVFERSASLEHLLESATELDAVVSQELLVAVFHPTSPLHDGAAVVAKGRLVAVGAFLPLSTSPDVARYFGTRHRAAIGVSEETDAVVVVVSEERGTVSLVRAGALSAVADTNALRAQLQQVFQPRGRSRGVLARLAERGAR